MQNHAWHIPKVIEITINISNSYGTTPFCHVLCLGMDSNVMHRFMVQVQDALFCSSTFVLLEEISFVYSIGNQLLSQLA